MYTTPTLLQDMFILNISVNDAMLALLGLVRGLGYLDKTFIGLNRDESTNPFCQFYAISLVLFG